MGNRAGLTSIDACNRFAVAEPPIVGTSSGTTEYRRIDNACPVHHTAACVETYIGESQLAKLTLLEFLAARRIWRLRTKTMRQHQEGRGTNA